MNDAKPATRRRVIDVSHTIAHGLVTYPGLPAPEIVEHLSRDASERSYGPGVRFHIGRISMVANTGTYIDSPFHRFDDGADLARLPIERFAANPGSRTPPPELERLTSREREVLTLVARGRSNAELAAELFVSEKTAKTHVSNILGKLGLASRTQAAVYALKEGLVSADEAVL